MYGTLDYVDKFYLGNLHAKHIMNSSTETELVEKYAEVGFKSLGLENRLKFGAHRGGSVSSEKAIIESMRATGFKRPVRLVITKDGRIWSDNTHTTVSWVLRLGNWAMVCEIPYYVVDLRGEMPTVYGGAGVLSDSMKDIRLAIACSYRIERLVEAGYRPLDVAWRIADVMRNLYKE